MSLNRLIAAALCAAAIVGAPRGIAAQEPPPHDMGKMMNMPAGPLGITMDRMGSGTSWIPDAVPLPSEHMMGSGWDLMLQGIGFGQYDYQSGPRGGSQFGSLNWGMLMAGHELAGGQFQGRTMLSLDPLGVTGRGYPLLLQTGESYHGDPLHDRQHPHDFFMELGALYERALAGPLGLSLYAAPSGEPALGPVAFPMRPSAMDNPLAPIGHHWQDATHISFGVLTAGVFTHDWKLEGSAFNGREPDDERWNFDPIRLDSYSGRVTYNPAAQWSIVAGYGYLASPDGLHPGASEHRVTGSLLRSTRLGDDGQWATAVVWGANDVSGQPGFSHSVLVESEAVLDRRNTIFGRAERVQKSAEDLALNAPSFGFSPDRIFDVSELSAGYVRELTRWSAMTIGVGAVGTVNFVPSALQSAYGSRTPLGATLFLRIRPLLGHAGAMGDMRMGGMSHDHP